MSLETVVERLKAKGPSGISPAQCWYCQRIQAWFLCDCPDVLAIRAGQKEPPRIVERKGQMFVILDEETIARNPGRKRYQVGARSTKRHRANGGVLENTGKTLPEPLALTDESEANPQKSGGSGSLSGGTLTQSEPHGANTANGEKPKYDRKTYQRELMRKRRAAAKGGSANP